MPYYIGDPNRDPALDNYPNLQPSPVNLTIGPVPKKTRIRVDQSVELDIAHVLSILQPLLYVLQLALVVYLHNMSHAVCMLCLKS